MSKKHYRRFGLWLTVALILATSCTAQAPQQTATPPPPTPTPSLRGIGDTLHILLWDAPTILNPHLSINVKDWVASRIVYEPLASYDNDGNLVPFLAAEIPSLENGDVASDGKSVTWKLKPDVQWSDGEPFTADDVLFTYQFIANSDVGSASVAVYDSIAGIDVIDKYTVKVNFHTANPAWAVPFVGSQGVILPKHKFEAYNGANAREAPANIEPVGTGPYRVLTPGLKPQEVLLLGTELVQTNKIIFEPNPYFRDKDKPYFSRIELRGGGTPTEAARQSLQTGEVDLGWDLNIQASDLTKFEQEGKGRVLSSFGSRVDQIELNRTDPNKETIDGERSSLSFPHPFFSDLKVRQAFAYAIDYESIVALYGPSGEPTDHILVSPPQYKSNKTFYTFDLKKAAALLDEAGWKDTNGDGIRDKDGVKMRVLFQAAANPVRQETQKIIKTSLESIGVEVEIKIIDASIFFGTDITNPNNSILFYADMQEFDWISVNPDPGLFLQYWTCAQVAQKANDWAGYNSSRWCDSSYDALYERSKTELDPEKRRDIFIQMNDMLTEEVVLIPLARLARILGVNRNLEGLAPTPWDTETWNIMDWKRPSP